MIRRGYSIAFKVRLEATYHFDTAPFSELELVPTSGTLTMMEKYRLLHRHSDNGLTVLYENIAFGSSVPVYPIPQPVDFYFLLRVKDASFWMYADVRNWKKDTVYYLSSLVFNPVPNTIPIPAAPLINPLASFPMTFRYPVVLQPGSGLLEVRNQSGQLKQTRLVRARDSSEAPGTKLDIPVDLTGFPEGIYELRYVNSGGTVMENVFCSPNHASDTLGLVHIKFRTGANPGRQYVVGIGHRQSDWFYEVHIRPNPTMVINPNQLIIQHVPDGEPPIAFNPLVLTPDHVQFKSAAPVNHWKRPFQFRLKNNLSSLVYVDPLPMPGPGEVQWDSVNLLTRIIVNI